MCSSYHREGRLWLGLVAFVVGAVMLLQQFDLVPAETWNYLWPAILIVTGLKWMVMGGRMGMNEECCGSCDMCGMDSCDGACEVPAAMPKKAMKKKSGKK